jgi:hypothetical protein
MEAARNLGSLSQAHSIRSLRGREHRHIRYIRGFVTWIRVPDGIEHPDPFLVVRSCDQFC